MREKETGLVVRRIWHEERDALRAFLLAGGRPAPEGDGVSGRVDAADLDEVGLRLTGLNSSVGVGGRREVDRGSGLEDRSRRRERGGGGGGGGGVGRGGGGVGGGGGGEGGGEGEGGGGGGEEGGGGGGERGGEEGEGEGGGGDEERKRGTEERKRKQRVTKRIGWRRGMR